MVADPSLPAFLPSSVVGGRDGLQDVLHDEGEGREAADHEEVGDGTLLKGVNPTLVAVRINLASPLNNATGAENSSDVQLSSLYAAAAADGDVAAALATPT